MHIVFQHPNPIPVQKYGGTERIIFWLMRYLAQMGHQVDFIGPAQSRVKEWGINHIVPSSKNWLDSLPKKFDCLHLFYPIVGLEEKIPTLFTIGGHGKWNETFPHNSIFVSSSHAKLYQRSHYVHNGIDLSEYPYKKKKLAWKNFLFLAKASWSVKNLSGCIQAVRYARKNLHIAGGRSLWSLCWPGIHSYGMVNQEEKSKIIPLCDALLFPVLWNEPFGLAIIEAMAYGLPIIGTNWGSLPELVPSKLGILMNNPQELKHILQDDSLASFFDPDLSRHHVEENYTHAHMARSYLRYYEQLLKSPSGKLV